MATLNIKDKISVCIATYNGERYIKEQLESILNQLDPEDELVISDDGSTDRTLEIIKCISDNRIKLFLSKKKRGYSNNFENALENSTGDIIFLSDQDDVWDKDKVRLSLEGLVNYDFVVSDCTVVDHRLGLIHPSHFLLRNVRQGFVWNWIYPRYVGACFVFRRRVLMSALPFPDNKSLCAHDYWICLIAELFFKVNLIQHQLIFYRRHEDNASTGGERSTNSLLKKLSIRAYVAFMLLRRALTLA